MKEAQTFLENKLPTIVGVEATKHFKGSFQPGIEGFTDQALEAWPDVSEKRKAQKRRANGSLSPILTDTGDLADSITWQQQGNNVVISSDLPYAQRHNEGTNGMPKRQFFGASQVLDRTIQAKIERELDRLFQ